MNPERRFKFAEWLSHPLYDLGMHIELFFDCFKKPAELKSFADVEKEMADMWVTEFRRLLNEKLGE